MPGNPYFTLRETVNMCVCVSALWELSIALGIALQGNGQLRTMGVNWNALCIIIKIANSFNVLFR